MRQPPYRYASHSPHTIPILTVFLFCTVIAVAGYHHVNYFKGVDAREKYDIFFAKVLKVKDIAILTFADLAQRLLVDYIRDVLLQPEAADWFRQGVSPILGDLWRVYWLIGQVRI